MKYVIDASTAFQWEVSFQGGGIQWRQQPTDYKTLSTSRHASSPETRSRLPHRGYRRARTSTSTWSPVRQRCHRVAQCSNSWTPCPQDHGVRPRGMKLSGGSRRNATHGIVDPALLRARLRRRPDLHLQRGEASNYALTLRPLWEAVARGDLEVLSSELTLGNETGTQLVSRVGWPALRTNCVAQAQLARRPLHPLLLTERSAPLDAHSQPRQFLRAQRRIHSIGPIHRAFHRPS